MSKRRRPDSKPAPGRAARQAPREQDRPRDGRRPGLLRDLLALVAAFAIGVGLAELFGAANLGVAFGVGQIVFAIVLVVLLTRD